MSFYFQSCGRAMYAILKQPCLWRFAMAAIETNIPSSETSLSWGWFCSVIVIVEGLSTYPELRATSGLGLMSVPFGWLPSIFMKLGKMFRIWIWFPPPFLEGPLIMDFTGDTLLKYIVPCFLALHLGFSERNQAACCCSGDLTFIM